MLLALARVEGNSLIRKRYSQKNVHFQCDGSVRDHYPQPAGTRPTCVHTDCNRTRRHKPVCRQRSMACCRSLNIYLVFVNDGAKVAISAVPYDWCLDEEGGEQWKMIPFFSLCASGTSLSKIASSARASRDAGITTTALAIRLVLTGKRNLRAAVSGPSSPPLSRCTFRGGSCPTTP